MQADQYDQESRYEVKGRWVTGELLIEQTKMRKSHKIISGTQKGIESAQKVGKTYNKFAQWLALPSVPDAFI